MSNSSLITFIVGPTATGKSDLALTLAKETNADMLSADSRQVYKDLPITTGVDIPTGFKKTEAQVGGYDCFTDGQTNLHGVAMLNSDQEWSVAHFRQLTEDVLSFTKLNKKKLIIVGGTGLYHHSLFLDKNILTIERSEELRNELSEKSVEELQQQLLSLNEHAQSEMNHSDWNNPRRLIRRIEKLMAQTTLLEKIARKNENLSNNGQLLQKEEDSEWIGLTAEKELLESRIRDRVIKRIEQGAVREVEILLSGEDQITKQILSTLGVQQIKAFLYDQISKEELIELWSKKEFQYAKRQLTWFKNRPYIKWTDIGIA